MSNARPTIAFLDHDQVAVATLLEKIRSREFAGDFNFESVFVPVPRGSGANQEDVRLSQVRQIVEEAVRKLDQVALAAVLVDLSYDPSDSDPEAVKRGCAVAAELQLLRPNLRVGVYSRYALSREQDIMVSLERFAIVLPRLNDRMGGPDDPGPTRWKEIFERLAPSTATVARPAPFVIFVAHAHADAKLAEALKELVCSALTLGSHTVFVSSAVAELQPGKPIGEQLAERVNGAKVLLAVMTKAARCAPFVWFEVGAARCWAWTGPETITVFTESARQLLGDTPSAGERAIDLTERKDVSLLLDRLSKTLRVPRIASEYYEAKLVAVLALADDSAK